MKFNRRKRIVQFTLTDKQFSCQNQMIGNEKSSPVLKTPYKICIVVKDCSVTSHSRNQEQRISQKVSITLQ